MQPYPLLQAKLHTQPTHEGRPVGYRYVGDGERRLLEKFIESQQCWRVGQPDGENFVEKFEDAFAARTGRRYVHAGLHRFSGELGGLGRARGGPWRRSHRHPMLLHRFIVVNSSAGRRSRLR